MKQQRTDARSLTADQQKRIEEVCFRSLALIGHNCEYLEQHFDRTGADESTRQAVADINAAAVKLDRTLSEAMTLLEFLRGDEKPQLYPVDLCDLLRQVAAQADMIRAQLGVEIHLDYGGWTSCCALQRCRAAVSASALQCTACQPGGRQCQYCAAPHPDGMAADLYR